MRVARGLALVAAVAALAVPQAALASTTVKLAGSTTVQPIAQKWASAYHKLHSSVSLVVAGGGSGAGFTNVDKGMVDIGMSSRDPKPAPSSEANLKTYVVARDAVAVIVNPNNKVRKLTPVQVNDIYTGKITNWKQVGGANKAIVLCGRTGASGTYEFFKERFLNNKRQSSRTKAYASNGMVRSAVARNKYAVGYVSLAYINKSVRGVSINGVAPTKANAAAGKYPYVRPLYFLTKGAATGETKKFIDWCMSSAGQKIATTEFLHR